MSTDQSPSNETQNQSNDDQPISEHPFDRLMFGPRERNQSTVENEQEKDNTILDQINAEEVMSYIDTLMGTAQQLKPMFSKIRPFVDQFLKK